jgi:hypothetical protein
MLNKTVTNFSKALCVISTLLYTSITYSAVNGAVNNPLDSVVEPANSVTALTLQNIAAQVDTRITSMKMLANTIANDTHIQRWVEQGFAPEAEALLVKKLGYLVDEYQLTSASFADTQTNKYWNHEGFLRVLKPSVDTWYFAYLASGQQDLISVYHDKNKHRVDLYVNYKQPNGNGLSGIATSFDGVVALLTASSLNQDGEVFIVDNLGVIQLHADPALAGQISLQQRYSAAAAQVLLTKQSFNQFESELPNTQSTRQLISSYIPSMGWFVVAQINTY